MDPLGYNTDTYMRRTTGSLRNIDRNISRLVEELRMKRRGSSSSIDSESVTSDKAAGESDLPAVEDQDEDHETQDEGHITEARQCNFLDYHESLKGQKRHVLDFLVAGNDLDIETSVWEDRHSEILSSTSSNAQKEEAHGSKTKLSSTIDKSTNPKDSVEDRWIHSVRINSAIVIRILRQLASDEGISMRQDFEQQPLTFTRPFSFLVHHHKGVKTRLADLRDQSDSEQSGLDSSLESCNRMATLKQVQCYVDFVENRLIPDAEKWTNMFKLKQQLPRIRFQDLWYLFKPGDLIYCLPSSSPSTPDRKGPSTYQFIHRVLALRQPTRKFKRGGPSSLTYDPVAEHESNLPEDGPPSVCFSVCAYYIEFDGEFWGAFSRCVHIPWYEGEKEITTLPAYPLKFRNSSEETLQQAVNDGKAIVNLIADRYGFYSGWSLISSPIGHTVVDAVGRLIRSPTHIESDVLVDFSEAFNTCPPWKPSFYSPSTAASGNTGSIGWRKPLPNIEWTDKHKTNAALQTKGRVVEWDGVDATRASQYWSRDTYLHETKVKVPSGEDFALIPRRFYAYSVWERKFIHLDIRALQPNNTTDTGRAFDQLQIGSDDKQMIQSLVHSHFHKKNFQTKHGIELQGQDLIRGKGKGLVILLHGVPGVGKTATAEAVAQKWQKPLFPITCGDLGITSETVEKALNEIFRLAHLWDCVLLLDEADVFITQRVKVGDLQRNGLVSGKSRFSDNPEYRWETGFLSNLVLITAFSLPSNARILQRNNVSDHKQTRST